MRLSYSAGARRESHHLRNQSCAAIVQIREEFLTYLLKIEADIWIAFACMMRRKCNGQWWTHILYANRSIPCTTIGRQALPNTTTDHRPTQPNDSLSKRTYQNHLCREGDRYVPTKRWEFPWWQVLVRLLLCCAKCSDFNFSRGRQVFSCNFLLLDFQRIFWRVFLLFVQLSSSVLRTYNVAERILMHDPTFIGNRKQSFFPMSAKRRNTSKPV